MHMNSSIQSIIKEFKTSHFILNCRMPLGYSTCLPILQIKNGSLCLLIPFLRYKVTGRADRTLVYPIRYTATLELPEERVVGFADLSMDKQFEAVDFSKPVGLFRHESIQHLTKAEYQALRCELLGLYDTLAAALLLGHEFTEEKDQRMGELLRLLVEPSLYPMYRALDRDFYERYLA